MVTYFKHQVFQTKFFKNLVEVAGSCFVLELYQQNLWQWRRFLTCVETSNFDSEVTQSEDLAFYYHFDFFGEQRWGPDELKQVWAFSVKGNLTGWKFSILVCRQLSDKVLWLRLIEVLEEVDFFNFNGTCGFSILKECYRGAPRFLVDRTQHTHLHSKLLNEHWVLVDVDLALSMAHK